MLFTQATDPQLLLGQNTNSDQGYVVAVLPQPPVGTGNTYTITDVLTCSDLSASIVFLQQPVGVSQSDEEQFVNRVRRLAGDNRIMAWMAEPQASTSVRVPLASDGSQTRGPIQFAVGPTLSVTLPANLCLTAGDDAITFDFDGGSGNISFTGLSSPTSPTSVLPGKLPCNGPNRGCLQFLVYLRQADLVTMNVGFIFGFPPVPTGNAPPALLAPLVPPTLENPPTPGFNASFDPLDPFNQSAPDRTFLAFTGSNVDRSTTVLTSTYTTNTSSDTVLLTPIVDTAQGEIGRLVFNYANTAIAAPRYFHLSPEGDFVLSLLSGTSSPTQLLCGLQGAEYFVFQPTSSSYSGDRLRYRSGQGAYSPNFPFPTSSPVSAPPVPGSSQLTTGWTTSWAMIVAGTAQDSVFSVAQPPGFNLFGNYGLHSTYPNLLGHADPANLLTAAPTEPFPLIPYSAVSPGGTTTTFTMQQVIDFEAQVLAPQRQSALAQDVAGEVLTAGNRRMVRASDEVQSASQTVSTSSGNIVSLPGAGTAATWTSILLGTLLTQDQDQDQQFAFLNPTAELRQAFQTGALFLVCANADQLGTLGGNGLDGASAFANQLTIGGWQMTANVGHGSAFGDYANVLIVKGVQGPLYDPQGEKTANLIANPAKWTNASTFAAPSTGDSPGPGDPSQLSNLSLWLQQYFEAAATNPDTEYFQPFNTLAKDPSWTGVLLLRGDVKPPTGLAGIMAGVRAPDRFYVHHLAIPVSPVVNTPTGPQVEQSSSVSGLVYYVDPAADLAQPAMPVPGNSTGDYDFCLLSLKVSFANSALHAFSSYAQVTLHRLFDAAVSGMGPDGNLYDAIVLTGSYQLVDNQPIYSLSSIVSSVFQLGNGALRRVEVSGMQMATQSADPTGDTTSQFTMTGYLDFAIVPGGDDNLDLFGFGNQAGAQLSHQGLAFSNLNLAMTFPTQTPQAGRTFALSSTAISFDPTVSTVRTGSLVKAFSLQSPRLQQSDKTPAELGFLPVALSGFRPGALGTSWYGLVLRVDLGTPGQLAGKAGLQSALLLAWSSDPPGGDGSVGFQIGLQLPGTAQGAPLISLQNILKLTIGPIQLFYDSTKMAYGLLLNEIALSFLGLLKIPPNGATAFYLFGAPGGSALGWYAIYNNEPKSGPRASLPGGA